MTATSSTGMKIARRTFLVAAGVVGGGILVGAGVIAARIKSLNGYRLPAADGETSFGAWPPHASSRSSCRTRRWAKASIH